MPINQKGGTPRIPGQAGFTFSRGKFLDGTIQTYFGPEQQVQGFPDSVVTPHDYDPPRDWPRVGNLLRVPQVAWLSIGYATQRSGFKSGGVVYSLASDAVGDHMASIEVIFQEVRTRLGDLRPGRTWAEIIAWEPFGMGTDGFPVVLPVPDYYLQPFTSGGPDPQSKQIPWLIYPDTAEPYFGLSFLHIRAGFAAANWPTDSLAGSPRLSDGFTDVSGHVSYDIFSDPVADHITLSKVADVVAAVVASREYPVSLRLAPGQSPLFRKYGSVFHAIDLYTTKMSYSLSDDLYHQGVGIDEMTMTSYYLISAAIVDQCVTDFGDFGFRDGGGTSAMTVDSVLAEIAEFFGFDPVTGLDLG